MTKNLLVELGLEELPAYVVTPSEKQLGQKMAAFLKDNLNPSSLGSPSDGSGRQAGRFVGGLQGTF